MSRNKKRDHSSKRIQDSAIYYILQSGESNYAKAQALLYVDEAQCPWCCEDRPEYITYKGRTKDGYNSYQCGICEGRWKYKAKEEQKCGIESNMVGSLNAEVISLQEIRELLGKE